MWKQTKAVGKFLGAEFKSVSKAYFAPVVGLAKGRPIAYTREAHDAMDSGHRAHWNEMARAFSRSPEPDVAPDVQPARKHLKKFDI